MTVQRRAGVYIRGEFGVRLEDDLHITEQRRGALHSQSESLERTVWGVKSKLHSGAGSWQLIGVMEL
jgi:Xaa-Pro aminopeptidase